MRKIVIHGPSCGSEEELAELTKLLSEAGCNDAEISVVTCISEGMADGARDACIFLVGPKLLVNEALQAEVRGLTDGRRAICIWQRDATEESVPNALTRFAYSILAREPVTIRSVLESNDVFRHQRPDGTDLPREPRRIKEDFTHQKKGS